MTSVRAPRHARFGYGDVINIFEIQYHIQDDITHLITAAHTRFIAVRTRWGQWGRRFGMSFHG